MKHLFTTSLIALALMFTACEKEDDKDDSGNNNGNNNGISLANVSNGFGKAGISGDTSLTIEGTATWSSTTDITSNGVTYSRWNVDLEGPNGQEVDIQIVEEQSTSTMSGPDDGNYTLGGSMDENNVSVRTGASYYSFSTTSNGSFTLSRGDSLSILEIDLEATGLEIGGIGTSGAVDIKAAIKATEN